MAKGIEGLIKKKRKMRLITCLKFSKEDIEAVDEVMGGKENLLNL